MLSSDVGLRILLYRFSGWDGGFNGEGNMVLIYFVHDLNLGAEIECLGGVLEPPAITRAVEPTSSKRKWGYTSLFA